MFVLVIEDDDGVADLILESLRKAGYETKRAASANEAIDVAIDRTPDIVTVDQALDRSRGTTAGLALRGMGITAPMFLLTGGAIGVDPRVYAMIGFRATIEKPFTDVAAIISEHLQHGEHSEPRK